MYACIVVCFGAPFGSVVGSYVHRLVLAWAIYLTDTVQLVAAVIIVEPWVKQDKPGFETPVHLTASSAAIFVSGLIFFTILQKLGQLMIEKNDKLEAQAKYRNDVRLITGPGLGLQRANELVNIMKSSGNDYSAGYPLSSPLFDGGNNQVEKNDNNIDSASGGGGGGVPVEADATLTNDSEQIDLESPSIRRTANTTQSSLKAAAAAEDNHEEDMRTMSNESDNEVHIDVVV
jgi:hypothetical protein